VQSRNANVRYCTFSDGTPTSSIGPSLMAPAFPAPTDEVGGSPIAMPSKPFRMNTCLPPIDGDDPIMDDDL